MNEAHAGSADPGLRLGVIIPCRNEAALIERKLANLARCEWPQAPGEHSVVIVDDGSTDGTAQVAQRAGLAPVGPASVRFQVLSNSLRAGKTGAIEVGCRALGENVDLLVLSDADVVIAPRALCALEARFRTDPRLALACGSQHFVRDLAADGSCRGHAGADLVAGGGLYDKLTALVRRLESRFGAVFSVHGQLCAWRRDLSWQPTAGMAADDLDLMLHARIAGGRVEHVSAAKFLEVKTPPGPLREEQAQRRARAYVQFLEHPRWAQFLGRAGFFARVHAQCYRRLPTASPWLALTLGLCVAAGALILAQRWWGWLGLLAVALGILALAASPVGRRLAALLSVIARAVRQETRGTLSDQWDTPRKPL